MSNSTKIVFAIVGSVMLLVGGMLTAVLLWDSGEEGLAEQAELRTYRVPPDYQDDLRVMLDSAMRVGDTRLGRVTSGPGGTLLVVAPPRLQAGVRQILDVGFEAPPVASPVTLSYWFLVGRPTESSGPEPFSMVGRGAPPQLESVLTQIASAQGPTEFSLLEDIQLTSMLQDSAEATGRFTRLAQRVTRTAEQVVVDVEISFGSNSLESRVSLEAGQFLVLGRSGIGGWVRTVVGELVDVFPESTSEDLSTLYYVMAADLEP